MMKLRLNRDKALLTPVIGVFWENKNRNGGYRLSVSIIFLCFEIELLML